MHDQITNAIGSQQVYCILDLSAPFDTTNRIRCPSTTASTSNTSTNTEYCTASVSVMLTLNESIIAITLIAYRSALEA